MNTAYDEILDFVTSAPTLEQIINFQHSETTQNRVNYLSEAEANQTITEDERDELREFRRASGFVEQLKIRAQRRLSN